MTKDEKPQPQVIEVHVKHDRGLIWFILFGWWYVAWLFLKWNVRMSMKFWAWCWNVGVKWPWQAGVWCYQQSVRGSKALTARYGWRGWAVVAVVVVVLAALGSLTNH